MTINNTTPILYSFRRCPYAMRARMALYYAALTVELREVVLRDKPEEMLDASPKGTVPVLVLPDSKVIDESLDIMTWALGQNDPEDWQDADDKTTEFLIERNDNAFKHALDRYKYPNRYPDENCTGARDDCEAVLKDMNERIEKNGRLCTNHITLADIALFPFVRQCAFTDKTWFDALPLPSLQSWLAEHLASDLFKNIMAKYDQWTPAAKPLYWGQKTS